MPQGLRYRRDTEESVSASATPTKLARRLVSAFLIIHFCGIFLAVTSYSSPGFPGPQLAVRASRPLQPYLQGTFLNNGYRFFAPNPGTPSVLWFRVQYEDRSVRWVELPGRPSSLLRAPHQRRLNLAIQVGQNLAPAPAEDGKRTLAPVGVRLVESCARHIANAYVRETADGKQLPVRSVGVYCVMHAVVLPEQVRAGWEPTDLRTYRAIFVGAYTPEGKRIDDFQPAAMEQPIAHLTAGIVDVDVLPRLRERAGRDRANVLAGLCLPEPIYRFLLRHPEILSGASGDELIRRIEALLPDSAGGSP